MGLGMNEERSRASGLLMRPLPPLLWHYSCRTPLQNPESATNPTPTPTDVPSTSAASQSGGLRDGSGSQGPEGGAGSRVGRPPVLGSVAPLPAYCAGGGVAPTKGRTLPAPGDVWPYKIPPANPLSIQGAPPESIGRGDKKSTTWKHIDVQS